MNRFQLANQETIKAIENLSVKVKSVKMYNGLSNWNRVAIRLLSFATIAFVIYFSLTANTFN
jgi:hypothetical protein